MTDKMETKLEKGAEEKRKLRKLEDDEEYDYITVPPDGSFGWIVPIACFVSNDLEFIFYNNINLFLSLLI